MGYAMAGNIRRKMPPTSALYVYDVYQPSCERFVSEYSSKGKVVVAASVKDATANSTVVISIVPTAANVRDVYLDETSGLVAAPPNPESLVIECSTIESASSREVGERLAESGHGSYVDAPVSVWRSDTTRCLEVLTVIGRCSCCGSWEFVVHDRQQRSAKRRSFERNGLENPSRSQYARAIPRSFSNAENWALVWRPRSVTTISPALLCW